MSHIFDKYARKHGHGPRIRVPSGVQTVTVEFNRGYVRIKTSSPLGGEIYLTRTAWFQVLRRAIPLTRLWRSHPAKDWDVPAATRQYLLEEQEHLEELRAQKRARKRGSAEDHQDEVARRESQKARHARAVRRRLRRERGET